MQIASSRPGSPAEIVSDLLEFPSGTEPGGEGRWQAVYSMRRFEQPAQARQVSGIGCRRKLRRVEFDTVSHRNVRCKKRSMCKARAITQLNLSDMRNLIL